MSVGQHFLAFVDECGEAFLKSLNANKNASPRTPTGALDEDTAAWTLPNAMNMDAKSAATSLLMSDIVGALFQLR